MKEWFKMAWAIIRWAYGADEGSVLSTPVGFVRKGADGTLWVTAGPDGARAEIWLPDHEDQLSAPAVAVYEAAWLASWLRAQWQ